MIPVGTPNSAPVSQNRFKSAPPPGLRQGPPPADPNDLNSVNLKPEPEDPKPPSNHKKAWTLAGVVVGTGLAASAIGGLLGGGLANPTPGSEAVQVAAHQGARETRANPSVLLDEASHPLAYEGVRFDVAPSVHSIGNAPAEIRRFEDVETKTLQDGSLVTHTYSYDRLDRRGTESVLYSTDQAEELGNSFQEEATSNWTTYAHLQPAGHAGRFVSVAALEGGNTGGVSGSAATTLATVDLQQGRQVTLDELLSPQELKTVFQQLDKVMGQNPRAENYRQDNLHELANRNFGLHQEGGKTHLTIQVPAQTQADHGKVAEFSFVLPSSVSLD